MFAAAPPVTLTEAQKSQLESLSRAGSTPQKTATRCRIILLAHQGVANHAIAQQLHVSRPTVLALRTAFADRGLSAITAVRKRKRAAKVLTPELEQQILDTTLRSRPGDGSTHWSVRTLPSWTSSRATSFRRRPPGEATRVRRKPSEPQKAVLSTTQPG